MQCVILNGFISDPLPVISGVPQGSILGPLLFLIFVNDIPDSVTSSTSFLFADDTKCLKTTTCLSECVSLQRDLQYLSGWSQKWNLTFNEHKCVLLRFFPGHSPHLTYKYSINSKQISAHDHHRDLGVIMSSNLSWNEHLKYILSKAYKTLGLIRRTFCSAHNPSTKKILYLSLVRPQLMYCSQIWRPHLLKDIITLEKVQRRATKFILNDFTSDYKSRLMELKILPLMMQLELNDMMFLLRCLKEPTEAFRVSSYVNFCSTSTRSSSYLKIQHTMSRTNTTRHFYFNRIPRLWNSFPAINLDLSSPSIKRRLQQFLWDYFIHNFDSDMPCSYHLTCPCAKCLCSPITCRF